MSKRLALAIQIISIVFLVILVYLPALHGGFIWDDDTYVTNNPALHDLGGLWRIWFQVGAVPQYYPLVHTTFWLEYHLWGLNPAGYHLVNVLLHAVAAILLGQVLRRLQIPGAWLAAVIFALHPVMVESATWITECKNVLSAVFYFAAALAWLRFGALEKSGDPTCLRWRWYFGALVLFAAALLSKTVTCSLPAALLLVGWWKNGRVSRSEILRLLPFFALGLGLGLVTAWIEKHQVGAQGAEWSQTFVERCLIAGRALWFYAGKLVWPVQLTFIYPRWQPNPAVVWQWLFPLAVLGVMAGLWLARRRIGRGPLVAVLFFAGTLGPALGFVNVYPMRYSFVADHFQYLASVGLITLCAVGLTRISRIIPATFVVLLGLLAWRQAGMYRDLETLWRTTLDRNPDCWMAHNNLGVLCENQGRLDEAMEHYHEAIRIYPDYCEALNNLGYALATEGRLEEAIQNYRQALRVDPDFFYALTDLGAALAAQGRWEEAIQNYRQALRINPDDFIALDDLGVALTSLGRFEEAIGSFRQSLRVNSNRAETYYHLGMLLGQMGRTREAVVSYREALKLNPDLPVVLNNLAWILAASPEARMRDGAEAVRLAERACELTGDRVPLLLGTLAAAYAEAGRYAEAVVTAEKAEQLATAAGSARLAEKIRRFLEFYRTGKPYHEPAPAGH